MNKSQNLNLIKHLTLIALKIIAPLTALTILGIIIDRQTNSNHVFTAIAIVASLPITYTVLKTTYTRLRENK